MIKFEKFLRQAIFQVSQKFTSAFRACQQLKTEVHLQAKEAHLKFQKFIVYRFYSYIRSGDLATNYKLL